MPMIPFSRTAAQMAATDATNDTFVTLETNARLARVPRLLILHMPAGDAYTVGADSRLEVIDDDNNVLFSVPSKGLFDQATAQSRILLPSTFALQASSTTFLLRHRGTLTEGTASSTVYFQFYFDEYPLTLI